jgi:AAA domain
MRHEDTQQRYTDVRQRDREQARQRQRFSLSPFIDAELSMALNYLIKGVLPRTGMVVVWGPPKCGKSFWTYDLVMHIVTGRPYRGRQVQKGTVVYLALEGGGGFINRVVAWRRKHFPNGQQGEAVPFFLVTERCELVRDHKQLIADIRAQLHGTVPACIVIDTLNRSIAGDENKSDDMTKYITAADAIREAFDCCMIIIHHCGTAGNRPRGHTSLAGADDCQIVVERDKNGVITCTVEHAKDFEAGTKFSSKLERVELGNDIEGDPITSCVIVEADPSEIGPKLSKTQGFAYSLLQRLIATQGIVPPADADLPADKRVCLSDVWRKEFYTTYPADKQDTKKKALLRATLDLEKEGLITLWREYVWLHEKRDN